MSATGGEVGARALKYPLRRYSKTSPWNLLAAGLGDDVDDGAGALAELRVVVAGLDAELLQGVRDRERTVHVGHFVDVVAAVEEVVRLVGQSSVGAGDDGGGECLAVALVDAVAFVGGVDYACDQRDQRGGVLPFSGRSTTRSWSMTCDKVPVVVSTCGAAGINFDGGGGRADGEFGLTVTAWSACSTMPVCVYCSNPGATTESE